jgi:hypothetical protein
MATLIYDSFGSSIKTGTTLVTTTGTSGGTYTAITPSLIYEIDVPEIVTSPIELPTALNSSSRFKDAIPGASSSTPLKFTANFTPGDVTALKAMWNVNKSWQIVLGGTEGTSGASTGKSIYFNGFVNGIQLNGLTTNGYIGLTVTVVVRSEPFEDTTV